MPVLTVASTDPLAFRGNPKNQCQHFYAELETTVTGPNVLGYDYQERNTNSSTENKAELLGLPHYVRRANKG